jgi:hypothetical protein
MAPVILPGDCILIDSYGFAADGIEWIKNSKIYHIAIYVGDAMVIEATETGVKKNPISKYNNCKFNWMVRRVKGITIEQTQKLIDTVISYIDKDNSFIQSIALGIFFLIKKITKKKVYQIIGQSEQDLMKCSELYCKGCISAGVDLFPDINVRDVTPEMLCSTDKMSTIRTMSAGE